MPSSLNKRRLYHTKKRQYGGIPKRFNKLSKSKSIAAHQLKKEQNREWKTSNGVPLLTINHETLMKHFDPNNVVYIHGMQKDERTGHRIYNPDYNRGKNVPNNLPCPVVVNRLKGKKIIVVARRYENDFTNKLQIQRGYHYISISTDSLRKEDEFVVVVFALNPRMHVATECKWDLNFIKAVKKFMSVNVRGDGKKHHQSTGKYYGLGLTAKYSQERVGNFTSKKVDKMKRK